MRRFATRITTDIGRIDAPLHGDFDQHLVDCQTDIDLFLLVFDDDLAPDAVNEIEVRGLSEQFTAWIQRRVN